MTRKHKLSRREFLETATGSLAVLGGALQSGCLTTGKERKVKPIGVQLYTLREEAEQDIVGVLKTVADIGYKGVETAGLYGLKPEEFRRIVEDLGMVISSNFAFTEDLSEVIDSTLGLGTDLVVVGWGPDDFASLEAIERTAETANRRVEDLSDAGLTAVVHNHYWEFDELDGHLAYDIFMEMCPNLKCEMDIYWAANFGACDPVDQVRKYSDRVVLLHVKDGPLVKDAAHVAVGSGKVDVPAAIRAADESVLQWLIVELDECNADMTQAVAESYAYLTGNGLAEGNK